MKEKKIFYTELVYLVGIVLLAFGTAWMERADFGMSMVVAPAYLVYLKVSQILPWFTFGMAEYTFQACLLVVIALAMRRFKPMYLFSFVTALFYGTTLDIMIRIVALLPTPNMGGRILYYLIGMVLCAVGVALLFHTYIAPEAYELFVKEIAGSTNFNINKVKTVYDCTSALVAVLMSFLFFGFGHFEGIKLGTIVCALLNGWLIGRCSGVLEQIFEFKNAL